MKLQTLVIFIFIFFLSSLFVRFISSSFAPAHQHTNSLALSPLSQQYSSNTPSSATVAVKEFLLIVIPSLFME